MDDFGGKLRQARERRGISLRQIAASTKIAAAALEALERNDISKLPGGIFSRAFVRSYAMEVGLDPEETVREFLDRFNREAPPSAKALTAALPEQEREFEQQQMRTAKTAGLLLLIPVAALILYFTLRRHRAPAVQPQASQAAEASPVAAPRPEPVATPAVSTPSAPDPGAPSGVVRQMTLEVHPTADCWISLTVDGRKLFARVVKQGEHESHTVTRDAVVEVGDAGAFAYSIDGRPGKPLGDKGQVKTLKLTPATVAQYVR